MEDRPLRTEQVERLPLFAADMDEVPRAMLWGLALLCYALLIGFVIGAPGVGLVAGAGCFVGLLAYLFIHRSDWMLR